MLADAALVQGPKGGASPTHSAGYVGFMGGPVQQNQVLFTTGTAQSRHLTKKDLGPPFFKFRNELQSSFSLPATLYFIHRFKFKPA